MGKPVSLFSSYSGKENRVTNYVMLIMRMLYEESPNYLSELLSNLLPDEAVGSVGISFSQQIKKNNSIPDGLLLQKALSIYIETKNFDWFSDTQLEKHLEALSNESSGHKVLIVLSNFEKDLEKRFEEIDRITVELYGGEIHFQAITFEMLLSALHELDLTKTLQDSVAELEYYFNEENLLPTWKGELDVVSCAGSYDTVMEKGVYFCPAQGGAYRHKRCKYFGVYRGKVVHAIAEIKAVIDVDPFGEDYLHWCNDCDEDKAISEAKRILSEVFPNSESKRVFLLGERHVTSFEKDSKGGMLQSKLYFDISSLGVKDSKELAESLTGKRWSEFR